MTQRQAPAELALERSAHNYITYVTQARDTAQAMGIISQVRPLVLRIMADLLYVDSEGHGVAWLRNAIINAARA